MLDTPTPASDSTGETSDSTPRVPERRPVWAPDRPPKGSHEGAWWAAQKTFGGVRNLQWLWQEIIDRERSPVGCRRIVVELSDGAVACIVWIGFVDEAMQVIRRILRAPHVGAALCDGARLDIRDQCGDLEWEREDADSLRRLLDSPPPPAGAPLIDLAVDAAARSAAAVPLTMQPSESTAIVNVPTVPGFSGIDSTPDPSTPNKTGLVIEPTDPTTYIGSSGAGNSGRESLRPQDIDAQAVLAATREPYVFRKFGQNYVVAYAKQSGIFIESLGLDYIARLLREPGRPVAIAVLSGRDLKRPIDTRTQQAVLDPTGIESCLKEIHRLSGEIQDAVRQKDQTQKQRLQDEQQKLIASLEKDTGHQYAYILEHRNKTGHCDLPRPRSLGPKSIEESERAAVQQALSRAYKLLEEHGLKELATHLRNAIKSRGNSRVYEPDRAIDWQL